CTSFVPDADHRHLHSFPTRRSSDLYALLGDAAHAIADPLRVATSLALEDAATLRALLAPAIPGRTLAAGLDAYASQRRARVLRLARQSRRLSAVLQARGGLAVRARELAFGSLAPKLVDATTAEAVAWQPMEGRPPTATG